MINNLKSDLVSSQKNYQELHESMNKKMLSLETIIQNQLKIGKEDSFANYIDMNDDMNFSLIKKGNKGE
jgi:seryl-tRNA synthetase